MRHEDDGLRYVYIPAVPRHAARRTALRHLVDTFFDGSAENVVAAVLGGEAARLSEEELERIAAPTSWRTSGAATGAAQLLAEVLRSVYWFNPLVWIAVERLRQESERACDDVVLGFGVEGLEYAAHLLDVARAAMFRGFPVTRTPGRGVPGVSDRRPDPTADETGGRATGLSRTSDCRKRRRAGGPARAYRDRWNSHHARGCRTANPDLAPAAVEAVRRWQFTPTLLNCAPIEIAFRATVNFRIE